MGPALLPCPALAWRDRLGALVSPAYFLSSAQRGLTTSELHCTILYCTLQAATAKAARLERDERERKQRAREVVGANVRSA